MYELRLLNIMMFSQKTTKKYRSAKRSRLGSTLLNTLIAVVILLIAFVGTSSIRYHSSLDARKAISQINAARIALLLSEGWRGIDGDINYDPISNLGSEITITSDEGPEAPIDYTVLDSYKIQIDNDTDTGYQIIYYATLSWKDVNTGLRALNITIAWAQKDRDIDGLSGTDKSYTLTNYVLTI